MGPRLRLLPSRSNLKISIEIQDARQQVSGLYEFLFRMNPAVAVYRRSYMRYDLSWYSGSSSRSGCMPHYHKGENMRKLLGVFPMLLLLASVAGAQDVSYNFDHQA